MIKVKITHKAMGVSVSASAYVAPGPGEKEGELTELVRELNAALRPEFARGLAKKAKRCALCQRALKEVALMVTSEHGTYICDDCVDNSAEIVAKERARKAAASEEKSNEP
jgi:hypothetical protein